MFSIRTVNLVWQKKHRGVYAPSPFALADSGVLALATPRPLEPRAYDFTVHKPDGGVEVRWGFSAETMIKMEVSHAENCIGMTSDDLYLLRNRSKLRFLTDKHINYIDAALSADGARLAAAFSDLAGASFAVAYGDISGRVIWLEEFDSPISVVAIARDGTRVATGLESGALNLLDQERRNVWTFELDAPVRSVACSSDANRVAYALEGGAVGLIGGDGARIWETNVAGNPVAVALTGDGGLCGVLAAAAGDPAAVATLYCLLQDGAEGWQYDTDRRSTGISLSPTGNYMAVGARDGTVTLFGIVAGEETGGQNIEVADSVLSNARELTDKSEHGSACALLRTAIAANAVDLDLFDEYIRIKAKWHASSVDLGKQALESGDYRLAIRLFAATLEEDPLYTQAAESLREARTARSAQLIDEAGRKEAANDFGGAEENLREAVAVAPIDSREPRRELAAFLERRARAIDWLADRLLQDGDVQGSLNSLMAAQHIRPAPERALRIRGMQIDVEFDAGMRAYDSKQYVLAVFQFKKVLRLCNNHSEALRHLEFAKRFSQETATDSLQDRFSRLE